MNTPRRAVALALVVAAYTLASSPAAIFTVVNTKDSGAGSLRQAVTNANGAPSADTIVFNIPQSPATIVLVTALPLLLGDVDILNDRAGDRVVQVHPTDKSDLSSSVFQATSGIKVTIEGLTIDGVQAGDTRTESGTPAAI